MPRIRSLFLLGLFIVNQAACYSWQAPKVTPQAYVAQHPDTKIRVVVMTEGRFATDSIREPGTKGQVLTNVRFSRDSIFGLDKKGRPVAHSLQLTTIEVREKDRLLTALAVIVVVVPVVLMVLAAISLSQID